MYTLFSMYSIHFKQSRKRCYAQNEIDYTLFADNSVEKQKNKKKKIQKS